jgi:hypothetical protein
MKHTTFLIALAAAALAPHVAGAQYIMAPTTWTRRRRGAEGLALCLLLAALGGGCTLRQALPREDVPAVLLAAFLDTRPPLAPGRRVVVGPYRLSAADTVPRPWADRDLRPILADTSVRLGDATIRGRTLEGRPLPWWPSPGEVGVSFSVPEFRNDTVRVLVVVEGESRSIDRLTLVRRRGRWTVVRREQVLVS